MTGVIYARYSSDAQREESIEGQIRECTEFAKRNGITILNTYIDRALSAKTDNRPEFQRIIKDSARHLFDVVIVWKLDRFARNRYDSAHYKAILRKNGVKVVSATEPISEDSTGILLESLLEGYAEFYSAELAEKVKRGHTENALKAKYNGGGMPLGYVKGEGQTYELDPKLAPLVLDCFTRYSEGKTIRSIVDWLNSSGVKGKRGSPVSINNVTAMLKNRRYIGEYIYSDIVIPNAIPAIVPVDLFDRVQQRMEKNKRAPARHKAEDDYLLTTKLFCGLCGAFMVGECGRSRTGAVHHYYKCVSNKKRRGCKKKAVKKNWIEAIIIRETMALLQDDDFIAKVAKTAYALQQKENYGLPHLRQQLSEVEQGIKNMVDAIQQGMFARATKERLDALEAEREKLEFALLQEEIRHPVLTEEKIRFWLRAFRALDMTLLEHRKRLVDSFVNSIHLYDDRIVVTFNYKDGAKTIMLADIPDDFGSDLDKTLPPPTPQRICIRWGIFISQERPHAP